MLIREEKIIEEANLWILRLESNGYELNEKDKEELRGLLITLLEKNELLRKETKDLETWRDIYFELLAKKCHEQGLKVSDIIKKENEKK